MLTTLVTSDGGTLYLIRPWRLDASLLRGDRTAARVRAAVVEPSIRVLAARLGVLTPRSVSV